MRRRLLRVDAFVISSLTWHCARATIYVSFEVGLESRESVAPARIKAALESRSANRRLLRAARKRDENHGYADHEGCD